ncbi:MAG TPA: hypothetical protein VKR55_08550 [Bradyrhizobium sp.]|uniref:hypothetical protein n=1 Tax=Bradyrhizobium sp. TaxID=376 RepID=UPI002B873500|nr:hypothetical protein [Bradyrhizobium sp.]HLZ02188.1 hypothetical protein [Bradyrhizobium sp.]
MSSRALIPATVLLLAGWFTPALAQENLEAGKTPSQIFAGTCTACHKSPRGLLKTVSPSSLSSFLRQHYTTSPNMAGVLASYLISNGATDTRIGADTPKGDKGAKGTKEGAKQEARQEARPEGKPDGRPEQPDRFGRRSHPAPQEAVEPKPGGEANPAQAAAEPTPEGHKNAKQRLSKRGRPGEALPKEEPKASEKPIEKPNEKPSETATREEPKSREEKPREERAREEAKPEAAKPAEPTKPAEEGRSQSAKVEPPAETPIVRPDPVPQVTPAPTVPSPAAEAPAAASAAASQQPVQAAVTNPAADMAVPLPANAVSLPPPTTATASSAPPLPAVAPAGPPTPPISQ